MERVAEGYRVAAAAVRDADPEARANAPFVAFFGVIAAASVFRVGRFLWRRRGGRRRGPRRQSEQHVHRTPNEPGSDDEGAARPRSAALSDASDDDDRRPHPAEAPRGSVLAAATDSFRVQSSRPPHRSVGLRENVP